MACRPASAIGATPGGRSGGPGRPVPGRPDRPVREPDRRRTGPLRAVIDGLRLGWATGGLGRRHRFVNAGATIAGPEPGAVLGRHPPPRSARSPDATVTAAQRLRLVLALGHGQPRAGHRRARDRLTRRTPIAARSPSLAAATGTASLESPGEPDAVTRRGHDRADPRHDPDPGGPARRRPNRPRRRASPTSAVSRDRRRRRRRVAAEPVVAVDRRRRHRRRRSTRRPVIGAGRRPTREPAPRPDPHAHDEAPADEDAAASQDAAAA